MPKAALDPEASLCLALRILCLILEYSALILDSGFLLIQALLIQQIMTHIFGFFSPTWETWREFLAFSFGPGPALALQAFGEQTNGEERSL